MNSPTNACLYLQWCKPGQLPEVVAGFSDPTSHHPIHPGHGHWIDLPKSPLRGAFLLRNLQSKSQLLSLSKNFSALIPNLPCLLLQPPQTNSERLSLNFCQRMNEWKKTWTNALCIVESLFLGDTSSSSGSVCWFSDKASSKGRDLEFRIKAVSLVCPICPLGT